MADNKKNNVIIIKKVGGGGHGAHGGAWKVAYADFVTAMMAFFMVMWLMGSDEETKAAVANYFNHPTTPWRLDAADNQTLPLGDKTGAGESIMKGAEGDVPQDLIERINKPIHDQSMNADANSEKQLKVSDQQESDLPVEIDYLRASIPENLLFAQGSDQLSPQARIQLARLRKMFNSPGMTVRIEGTQDSRVDYDRALTRLVAVRGFFVAQKWVDEDRLHLKISDATKGREPASRKITITATR